MALGKAVSEFFENFFLGHREGKGGLFQNFSQKIRGVSLSLSEMRSGVGGLGRVGLLIGSLGSLGLGSAWGQGWASWVREGVGLGWFCFASEK